MSSNPERIREQRAAELAWHFREGGDSERALAFSLLAGGRAEGVFALAEAERHYRAACALAGETDDARREAEALEKLGRVLTNVGRYEEARGALEQAARLYGEMADEEGEIRITVQLGSVHRQAGTPDEGIASVQALLQRLDVPGRRQDVAELYIVLETLYYSTGRYAEGLTAAERATELARVIGERGGRAGSRPSQWQSRGNPVRTAGTGGTGAAGRASGSSA